MQTPHKAKLSAEALRVTQLEHRLRKLRSHPALFGDAGAAKEEQVSRLISKCKQRLTPHWDFRAADQLTRKGHWMYAAEGYL